MSVPISAISTSAVVLEIPGIEHKRVTAASKGATCRAISALSVAMEASRWSMWPMISLHMKAWCSEKRPLKASSSWGSFERRRDLAIWARTAGSRSPAMSASIMAREDWDHTVEATEVSLMPASWRIFSRRWISLPRAST